MIYWLLAREVLILTKRLAKDENWDVLVDMFYHQKEEEIKAKKPVEEEAQKEEEQQEEEEQEDFENDK